MTTRPEAIVIGASSGAIEALKVIVGSLPASFPIPILIVVHIPPDRPSALVEVLRRGTLVCVSEAEDKEPVCTNRIYIAPPDYHLMVEKHFHLSLIYDEAENFSRPAIDVLFETAADAYGSDLLGIILTGANGDGSRGLQKIVEAGGRAVVQCPESALSPDMPKAAIKKCPTAEVLRLEEIADYLLQWGSIND
ncbi:chemotaxis protein CheB [Bremerella alba]|uniref:protein-glutamate methylesterase n=1 Tax=Bremerella alba TaxID=980252 RepID=A0A7V8V3A7_9BACT|nr:chemotaxis protein CheB [Bremerella alba]MBA2114153.1 Chemotaxis response regulator protein-glutamate methylesterase [Bremerella alba]